MNECEHVRRLISSTRDGDVDEDDGSQQRPCDMSLLDEDIRFLVLLSTAAKAGGDCPPHAPLQSGMCTLLPHKLEGPARLLLCTLLNQ
jgi:hypothetical protein